MSIEIKLAIVFVILLCIGGLLGYRFAKSEPVKLGLYHRRNSLILKTPDVIDLENLSQMVLKSFEDTNCSVDVFKSKESDNYIMTLKGLKEEDIPLMVIENHYITEINLEAFNEAKNEIGLIPFIMHTLVYYDDINLGQ